MPTGDPLPHTHLTFHSNVHNTLAQNDSHTHTQQNAYTHKHTHTFIYTRAFRDTLSLIHKQAVGVTTLRHTFYLSFFLHRQNFGE